MQLLGHASQFRPVSVPVDPGQEQCSDRDFFSVMVREFHPCKMIEVSLLAKAKVEQLVFGDSVQDAIPLKNQVDRCSYATRYMIKLWLTSE